MTGDSDKLFVVYRHICPNGKMYIGVCQNPSRRWRPILYKGCRRFSLAIDEFGWENIKHEIIANDLNEDQAYTLERQLIRECKSDNEQYGYNISAGGKNNTQTEESRILISQSLKAHYSDENARQKLSQARLGHYVSVETKRKLSNAANARCGTLQGKQQLAAALKKSNAVRSKRIICVDTNEEYESAADAWRKTGINKGNIASVCSGKRKTAGGYEWRYV